MAIFDRAGAAERVGRDVRVIRRWESLGWLTFVIGRVREEDLLRAEALAEANKRRGGRKKKGAVMFGSGADELEEAAWPDGAVADGLLYSLEVSARMRFDTDLGARWFAGEQVEPWVLVEPGLVDPPEFETMTGTYADVSRRAGQLNQRIDRSGVKAFIFYPSPIEPASAR